MSTLLLAGTAMASSKEQLARQVPTLFSTRGAAFQGRVMLAISGLDEGVVAAVLDMPEDVKQATLEAAIAGEQWCGSLLRSLGIRYWLAVVKLLDCKGQ
jgi:hypothetical protein